MSGEGGERRFDGEVELVEITTQGDTDRSSLSRIGGAGVFVSALRDTLLDGTVDVAVHSMKDLPTAHAEGSARPATEGGAPPGAHVAGACRSRNSYSSTSSTPG